ncbi:MAG: hypothetical protein Q9169_002447 [Polycauliona sp. 2 TL-2023]
MKRQRIGDDNFGRGVTLQQRRSGPTAATPQLTLTLPPSSTTTTHANDRVASAMIWMPDEQMWLTAEEVPRRPRPRTPTNNNNNNNNYNIHEQNAYIENSFYARRPDYPRSEPSPGPYTYYDITPPASNDNISDDEDSPVLSQFRSLLTEPRNEEMLSPLFQEAIHSIPFSDSASLYSRPSEEFERIQSQQQRQQHWRQQQLLQPEDEGDEARQLASRSSGQQSFHTAVENLPSAAGQWVGGNGRDYDNSAIEFLAGGPIRPLGDLRREHVGWGNQARRLARSSSR